MSPFAVVGLGGVYATEADAAKAIAEMRHQEVPASPQPSAPAVDIAVDTTPDDPDGVTP